MEKLEEISKRIVEFRDARDWKQFHNPKDLSLSLLLEAAELVEHFQWKNTEEMHQHVEKKRNEVGEELADVLYWVLLISHDLKIDVLDALDQKMRLNEQKYPVEKARGNHTKYNKL